MAKIVFKKPLIEDKQKITLKFRYYKYQVKLLFSIIIIQSILITYLLVK